MTTRILKISYQEQPRKRRTKHVPKLILAGEWFKNAGFPIGEFVRITVADNIIQIIRKEGGNNAA